MKRKFLGALIGVALLALAAGAAGAEEVTVNSILAAHSSGAPANGIIAMVRDPANTINMAVGDLATLRAAGVPENVISVIWAFLPAPTPAPAPLQPDDARLGDVVLLISSGMSDANIAEKVRQSGQAYDLSINDLLYLKQSGAGESTIAALMATHAGALAAPVVAPAELVFDDLELKKTGFWRKDRKGRLVLRDGALSWVDNRDPGENFTFQTTGLEKVWFTCDARSSGNFCYQINFKIVKGDRYRFRDIHRKSGSNAAVTKVMDTLRTYFPRLNYSTPSVDD